MSIKPCTQFAGGTKDERLALVKTLNNAGIYEYRENYYSKPKYSAQQQLRSKGHYVDDDTLRVFDAKILDCGPILDGLFFYIRESKKSGFDSSERVHSYVYFDVWGNVVEKWRQKSMKDECYSTRQLDVSDQAYFSIDVVKYYRDMLDQWIGIHERNLNQYKSAFVAVSKMQTAELV